MRFWFFFELQRAISTLTCGSACVWYTQYSRVIEWSVCNEDSYFYSQLGLSLHFEFRHILVLHFTLFRHEPLIFLGSKSLSSSTVQYSTHVTDPHVSMRIFSVHLFFLDYTFRGQTYARFLNFGHFESISWMLILLIVHCLLKKMHMCWLCRTKFVCFPIDQLQQQEHVGTLVRLPFLHQFFFCSIKKILSI